MNLEHHLQLYIAVRHRGPQMAKKCIPAFQIPDRLSLLHASADLSSKISHDIRPPCIHGIDGVLPDDGSAAHEETSEYAEVRSCRYVPNSLNEDGKAEEGRKLWNSNMEHVYKDNRRGMHLCIGATL